MYSGLQSLAPQYLAAVSYQHSTLRLQMVEVVSHLDAIGRHMEVNALPHENRLRGAIVLNLGVSLFPAEGRRRSLDYLSSWLSDRTRFHSLFDLHTVISSDLSPTQLGLSQNSGSLYFDSRVLNLHLQFQFLASTTVYFADNMDNSEEQTPSPPRVNGMSMVVVMGVTGSGKSYLINKLAGREVVKEGADLEACE